MMKRKDSLQVLTLWLTRHAYMLMLQLYPINFRRQFETEMLSVFSQAAAEKHRWRAIVHFFFREVIGLLSGSFAEQREELFRQLQTTFIGQKEVGMKKTEKGKDHVFGSWRQPVMAGAPHLLFVVIMCGLGPLINTHLLIGFMAVFFLIVIAVILFAWRCGWPVWWFSWGGYASLAFMMGLYGILYLLGHTDDHALNNILILGWIGLLVIFYLVLSFRHPLKAALFSLFILPVSWLMLGIEFVPDQVEVLIFLLMGILTALASGLIVWLGNWILGMGLAAAVNLLAGIGQGLAITFTAEYPVPANTQIWDGISMFILYTVAMVIFLSPSFLHRVWHWWQGLGRNLSTP